MYHLMFILPFLFFLLPLAFRVFFVVVEVEGQSMSPILNEGDRVLVWRHWPQRWFRRGQIVLVWPWQARKTSNDNIFGVTPFIKRIVGLPGDSLVTYIHELDNYHRQKAFSTYDASGKHIWHVPCDHIFLRGDHPVGGYDSLSWGPVPTKSVLGIVIKKIAKSGRNSIDKGV